MMTTTEQDSKKQTSLVHFVKKYLCYPVTISLFNMFHSTTQQQNVFHLKDLFVIRVSCCECKILFFCVSPTVVSVHTYRKLLLFQIRLISCGIPNKHEIGSSKAAFDLPSLSANLNHTLVSPKPPHEWVSFLGLDL